MHMNDLCCLMQNSPCERLNSLSVGTAAFWLTHPVLDADAVERENFRVSHLGVPLDNMNKKTSNESIRKVSQGSSH